MGVSISGIDFNVNFFAAFGHPEEPGAPDIEDSRPVAGRRDPDAVRLGERDELITMLARSDPASIERLVRVYSTYSRVVNNGK